MAPQPLSWSPSQYWDGVDGLWSSFALRAGSPEQTLRVFISTAGTSLWAVSPQGCPKEDPPENCADSRGGLFNSNQSQTWNGLGINGLGPNEVNLGYNDSGLYGTDTLSLGFNSASGGPTVDSQVVAAFANYDYYLGSFGLSNQPTNLTNMTEPMPSYLTSLQSKDLIPSLSWAYTAGAHYQSKGVLGSLIFGGYDSSRFEPNDVEFTLAPDVTRDIVVGVQKVTASYENGSAVSLLPDPKLIFIDSTLPFIYLPNASCQLFEKSLGLEWDPHSGLYTVSDALHQNFLQSSPNFTFSLGNSLTGGPTVDIHLPYASFDLTGSYPFVANTTRYFPLQRATNDSQLTLGRAFLQEAYLIVNYEHSNFSVSQAKSVDGVGANIVALPSAKETPSAASPAPANTSHHSLNVAAIAGGIAGGVAFLVLLAVVGALIYIFKFRRKEPKPRERPIRRIFPPSVWSKPSGLSGLHEIHTQSLHGQAREIDGWEKSELLDASSPSGSGHEVSEISEAKVVSIVEMASGSVSSPRSSARSLISKQDEPRKKLAIMVSNSISRDNSTIFDTSVGSPVVETTISAAISRSSKLKNSYVPPVPQVPAQAPDWYKEVYLNRPLPPVPSSDNYFF